MYTASGTAFPNKSHLSASFQVTLTILSELPDAASPNTLTYGIDALAIKTVQSCQLHGRLDGVGSGEDEECSVSLIK